MCRLVIHSYSLLALITLIHATTVSPVTVTPDLTTSIFAPSPASFSQSIDANPPLVAKHTPADPLESLELHSPEQVSALDSFDPVSGQDIVSTLLPTIPTQLLHPPSQNAFLHPISIVILLLAVLGFISTFSTLPFNIMPSDPRASSSAKPSSSSAAKPSASSSAEPSSSSSSSAKPSSSSSGSSSSSSSSKPPQPTPYISPNAWMSFFLFVCLVLIILQGPLGLTGGTGFMGAAGGNGFLGGMPSMGGLPGCNGFVAQAVPWCQPVMPVAPVAPVMAQNVMMPMAPPQMYAQPAPPVYVQRPARVVPQMGGQGVVAGPNGGGGYSWYANPPNQYQNQGHYRPARPVNVQYERPGYQVQVNQGGMLCWYFPQACQPLILGAYALPDTGNNPTVQVQRDEPVAMVPEVAIAQPPPVQVTPAAAAGMANLENAFYPLLVGAIALLVVFDYAS